MMKMKLNKKIAGASAMLLLSATMLGTSTFAWFTMNKQVEVTGMQVKTKVSSNLLICTTNMDADYSANTLIQSRKALLEPVSTTTGATGSYYYTVDAKADGSKDNPVESVPYKEYNENATTVVANAVAGKANYDSNFNKTYLLGNDGIFTSSNIDLVEGTRDGAGYGYVDYIFYLKATSDAANQKVVMTKCDIDYDGGAVKTSGTVGTDIDRAWRTAIFAENVTSSKPGTGTYTTEIATVANQKGLISLADAAYFDGKAVSGTAAKAAITNNASTNGVVIGTITDANSTQYYKVKVRLWLEGEDTTCNSKTYAALTKMYSLDLQFKLVDSTDTSAVKNMTTNQFAADTTHSQSGSEYNN